MASIRCCIDQQEPAINDARAYQGGRNRYASNPLAVSQIPVDSHRAFPYGPNHRLALGGAIESSFARWPNEKAPFSGLVRRDDSTIFHHEGEEFSSSLMSDLVYRPTCTMQSYFDGQLLSLARRERWTHLSLESSHDQRWWQDNSLRPTRDSTSRIGYRNFVRNHVVEFSSLSNSFRNPIAPSRFVVASVRIDSPPCSEFSNMN